MNELWKWKFNPKKHCWFDYEFCLTFLFSPLPTSTLLYSCVYVLLVVDFKTKSSKNELWNLLANLWTVVECFSLILLAPKLSLISPYSQQIRSFPLMFIYFSVDILKVNQPMLCIVFQLIGKAPEILRKTSTELGFPHPLLLHSQSYTS